MTSSTHASKDTRQARNSWELLDEKVPQQPPKASASLNTLGTSLEPFTARFTHIPELQRWYTVLNKPQWKKNVSWHVKLYGSSSRE